MLGLPGFLSQKAATPALYQIETSKLRAWVKGEVNMRITVLGLVMLTLVVCSQAYDEARPVPGASVSLKQLPSRYARNQQPSNTSDDGINEGLAGDFAAALAQYSLGEAVEASNLAVIPILSTHRVGSAGQYLTASEALKDGTLLVEEAENGAAVPTLEVCSKSEAPILLSCGSVLTGGKQDRMIREALVLNPGERREIGVYCIESGRWSGGDSTHTFHVSWSAGSSDLKALATKSGSQSEIWNKVSEVNVRMANRSRTSNYQGNFKTESFRRRSGELEPVKKAVMAQDNACGAVVLVDGEVIGLEIFDGPDYFKRVWPMLFDGYVIDAILSSDKPMSSASGVEETAAHCLAQISTTVGEDIKEEDGVIRMTIETSDHSGNALFDKARERFIYLGLFPKAGD
jgi:hypothetical protein